MPESSRIECVVFLPSADKVFTFFFEEISTSSSRSRLLSLLGRLPFWQTRAIERDLFQLSGFNLYLPQKAATRREAMQPSPSTSRATRVAAGNSASNAPAPRSRSVAAPSLRRGNGSGSDTRPVATGALAGAKSSSSIGRALKKNASSSNSSKKSPLSFSPPPTPTFSSSSSSSSSRSLVANVFGGLGKLFGAGDASERTRTKYQPMVDAVNALEPSMSALSDEGLKAKTQELRERALAGTSLDDLLPEAFAVVREASKRVLGLRPFDVQLIGGAVLHNGQVAEMRTGEGKTLVAVLPAYLNALTGRGVHVVTVNDYLARRDSEWVGQVHKFLGLSVGLVQSGLDEKERKEAYNCDVTYVTNSELGFDYLRDNLASAADDLVLRKAGFNFCVIDEVDSILIDEARTPLIISGPAEKSSEKYVRASKLANAMAREVHYTVDEKQRSVLLTEGELQLMRREKSEREKRREQQQQCASSKKWSKEKTELTTFSLSLSPPFNPSRRLRGRGGRPRRLRPLRPSGTVGLLRRKRPQSERAPPARRALYRRKVRRRRYCG